MEIKLCKLRNISRRLCEEVAAPKGAEAHNLETTASIYSIFPMLQYFYRPRTLLIAKVNGP
jgi:hypothetical protein